MPTIPLLFRIFFGANCWTATLVVSPHLYRRFSESPHTCDNLIKSTFFRAPVAKTPMMCAGTPIFAETFNVCEDFDDLQNACLPATSEQVGMKLDQRITTLLDTTLGENRMTANGPFRGTGAQQAAEHLPRAALCVQNDRGFERGEGHLHLVTEIRRKFRLLLGGCSLEV